MYDVAVTQTEVDDAIWQNCRVLVTLNTTDLYL